MEHSQECNISYHFKCVSQTHGQRQDWPQQPDETDHHLGGALALLLGQRMNNGVIPVNTDGNKCPHRGVHLTNIIVRASCLQRNSYCFAGNCTFAHLLSFLITELLLTYDRTERVCMKGQSWHMNSGRSHLCISAALNWNGIQNTARITSDKARLEM